MAAMKEAGVTASAVAWTANRKDLAGVWRVWRWLREHKPEVVHVHHGGKTLRILCHMAGVSAVVQHIHGGILESDGNSVAGLDLGGADAVIACAQAVADRLPQCRAEVIYAGVETGKSPPVRDVRSGPMKLGILARLIPLKNVEGLIEASARLAAKGIEVQVEIAGSGPSEGSLRAMALSLGVQDRVRLLGWQQNIGNLLSTWDLLMIPSFEEGLPLSALEAMALARPVIASRVGGLPELIVDGETGILLPPGDTDAMVECIAELANDRERLERIGIEGWKHVRADFSSEQMARRTTELYDRLLKRMPEKEI